MKKIYLALGFGALILGVNAQQNVPEKLTSYSITNTAYSNSIAKTASTSTLMPVSMGATGCASVGLSYYSITQYTATPTYTVDARGYSFGTNVTYYTTGGTTYTVNSGAAAQKYSVTGTGVSITDVLVIAAKASSNAGTSMVNAKILSENAVTKAPNTQIGSTATMMLNMLTTSGYNDFVFGTPVPVSAGNFFAAIESPLIGGATMDTLAIASSVFGCSSTDSLAWSYTTYNPAAIAPKWNSVKQSGQKLDLAIFPVLNITTGLNTVSKGDLTLSAAYPNPASNQVSINYSLSQSGKVQIDIYDVTGKLVNTTKFDNLESGSHISNLDISNLNSGVYMYSIQSNSAKMFSKFTITK